MEHLDAIVKLTTLLLGFAGIAKWIVHRIERGQREVITEPCSAANRKETK